jgi:phosphoglycolate phosphatase
VFDLDGTLIDSAADIASALARTLDAAGLAGFDVDAVKTMIGGGSRKLIERALAAHGQAPKLDLVDGLRDAFERLYLAEPCRHTRVFAGAIDLLDALAARGVGLGLCTNKPVEITDRLLVALRLDRYFSAVAAGSDGVPKKPDPTMLLAVLSRLRAKPHESVLLGDSAADVGCARAAGCPVALVSFGYAGGNTVALGPDAVIDAFSEATSVLAQLFAKAAVK